MTQNPQQSEPWTILKLLEWTVPYFEKRGIESARLNAELLLSKVLGLERIMLYARFDKTPDADKLGEFREYVKRRAAREPLQYLLGKKEFHGRPFHVEPGVLIPRPETELVVQKALELIPADTPARVVDVCTGSGCVALTLAAERPGWRVWGTDISEEAVAVARRNAESLELADRVDLRRGSLLEPLGEEGEPRGSLDAIVGNPPYIRSELIASLQPEIRDHEPRIALDGGPDGLAVYRELIPEAAGWLKPLGWLVLELDPELQEPLGTFFASARNFFEPNFFKNLGGKVRVVTVQRRAP